MRRNADTEHSLVPEISGVPVYTIDITTGADTSVASVDPIDRFVYVVNDGSGNVSEFTLESSGRSRRWPIAGVGVGVGAKQSWLCGGCMALTQGQCQSVEHSSPFSRLYRTRNVFTCS
jgi:hypothetical protein